MSPARRVRCAPAFTLIELLTVTAVIAILAGFTLSAMQGVKQRATIARAKSELAHLAQALEEYRRHYGDYPQTGAAAHATAVIGAAIGTTSAEALLFNALTGVFGPSRFSPADRLNGPVFVDLTRLAVETPLTTATFAVPIGSPPQKTIVPNSFVDPWGRRYQYYYRTAAPASPTGTTAVANAWLAGSFLLYAVGSDGSEATTPARNTGLYSGTTQTTGANADNIYADKLP